MKIFQSSLPEPGTGTPKVVFRTEISGQRLWVKKFYYKKEFEAALFLQIFLANNGITVPNLVIGLKKAKILVENFIVGRSLLDYSCVKNGRVLECLKSGIKILAKFHNLKPDKKALFIKTWGALDFQNKTQELGRLVDMLKINMNHNAFQRGSNFVSEILKTCSETFFIHRDFNCRNVLVSRKGLVIIDFDRASYGSFLWDLVSWLEHPMLKIPEATKKTLIGLYKTVAGFDFAKEQYQAYLFFRALHALVFRLRRLVRGISDDYFSASLIQTLDALVETSKLEPRLEQPLKQLKLGLLSNQSITKANFSL